jgi:pimeloyl-ACP methyl ester carboxylesterase
LTPFPGDPPSDSEAGRGGLDWETLQRDREHGVMLQRASLRTLKAGRAFNKSWSAAAPTAPLPVLVLLARHDQIMNNAAAEELFEGSEALRNGRVTVRVLDGGHAIQLTDPGGLAREISGWSLSW